MSRKKFICTIGIFAGAVLLLTYAPALAEDDVQGLKKQIEQLQKRVDELESQKTNREDNDPHSFLNRRRNRTWDPFEEMHRIQEEMDQMFQNSFSFMGNSRQGMFSNNMSFNYDFDLKDTGQGYEITFDMKGLDEKSIDIDINENSITVKGEGSREETEESPNAMFKAQSYGSFLKTIPLPVDADTTKVKTEKQGDALIIKLPKKIS